MKRKRIFTAFALLLSLCMLLCGCSELVNDLKDSATSTLRSTAESMLESYIDGAQSYLNNYGSSPDKTEQSSQSKTQSSAQSDAEPAGSYTMADVKKLKNTEHFAKNTLEHIFDGTINGKGKATGYHYSLITDSKGEIIDGTRSGTDRHGVFTGEVKVNGVKKSGFSSFYPESYTPQQVVDAINEAYDYAINDPGNPHGSLWIGYSGDLEIDMYLDDSKKITTAYPIYEGD